MLQPVMPWHRRRARRSPSCALSIGIRCMQRFATADTLPIGLDLTQDYFVHLLEKGTLAAADQRKGRFRAFLKTDCDFFLSHRREADRALKRGGGNVPLSIDACDAEGRYLREPADAVTPEVIFDRSWATSLLAGVVRPGSTEMPGPANRAGRLRLLGEIARGGMGAILKGRDEDLGRDLTVKVLLEAHCDHPDLVRRFVEEAQICGQLQHPGIVPIYEMGTFDDRRPYFSMKLVKGKTLAELLSERGRHSTPSLPHATPRALATAKAGLAFGTQPVVNEEDQFGNLETGDESTTVKAALRTGTGPSQGTTAVAVAGGIVTFTNLADDTAEVITLIFTASSLPEATSTGVTISPAAANHFAVSIVNVPNNTVTAGDPFTISVTALDAFGNVATGFLGTVHFTSSDKRAVLPEPFTFTMANKGVHVFGNGVTLETAGNQTVTVTDRVSATITGTSTNIDVVGGGPALVIEIAKRRDLVRPALFDARPASPSRGVRAAVKQSRALANESALV